jgi:menaquinone-dependent protoporphyrinogen oxidase
MTRILIVHGSRMGATEGIAEQLAAVFADRGIRADVRAADVAPAPDTSDPGTYDAVIVGGALYAGHWMAGARRYVQANTAALRRTPVWLFSSGPLDDSAERAELEPVREVEQLAWSVAARGHETFGGKLDRSTARGLVARLMARTRSGDWRDQRHIAAWADSIADALNVDDHVRRRADELAAFRRHPSFDPNAHVSPTGS